MSKQNTKIKVSVVVPIYNVEKYLDECLTSLARQTLKEIEIICVNDGSTDGSLAIIKRFMANDPRFVLIDKKNSGYGDSMNKGFERATGEFIGIVESDDFVDKDMFKTLYSIAVENDAEVVKSNAFYYWTDTNKVAPMDIIDEKYTKKAISPTGVSSPIFYRIPSIWSAIYRRDFIEKHNIAFLPTPGASYQDTSFSFKVWLSAEKVIFTDKRFLYYRQDNAASSMNNIAKKASAIWAEFDEIEKFAKAHCPDQLPMIYERRFIHAYNFLLHMRGGDVLKFACEMSREMKGRKPGYSYFQSKSQFVRFLLITKSPHVFFATKNLRQFINKLAALPYRFLPSLRRKEYIEGLRRDLKERKKYPGPQHFFSSTENDAAANKISVIIPTCNDGEIICKSVNSVLAQTYKDLEIIIVNDGNEESSAKIIEKLAKKDKRIQVFCSNHSGVAKARNVGLSHATAPFVMWCDSDDSLAPDACEKLLSALLEYDADFATCETNLIFEQSLDKHLKQGVDYYLQLHFSGRQILNTSIITRTDASLWNKIYKRDIIEENHIAFPDGLCFEDAYFNDVYMVNASTGYYLGVPLYNYLRKSNSIMSQTFKKTGISADYCQISIALFDYLQKNNLYEKHQDLYWCRFCQYNFFAFSHLDANDRRAARHKMQAFLDERSAELKELDKVTVRNVKKTIRSSYSYAIFSRNLRARISEFSCKISPSHAKQTKEIKKLEEQIRQTFLARS